MSRPSLVTAFIALLSAACGVDGGTVSNVGVEASRASLACNGSVTLCERTFDDVTLAMTHNGFASIDDGFHVLVANHDSGIRQQLEDGIRGFMLDIYREDGETVLCHGYCNFEGAELGRLPLDEALGWMVTFLDANPREVIAIEIQAGTEERWVEEAFEASGLIDRVHVHAPRTAWPTLAAMIETDERVVVLTSDGNAQLPWHHRRNDLLTATDYAFSLIHHTMEELEAQIWSEERCTLVRGDDHNELVLVNHFITRTAGDKAAAAVVNANPQFGDRIAMCAEIHGRRPTFIAVDYYGQGDVMAVVDQANGL